MYWNRKDKGVYKVIVQLVVRYITQKFKRRIEVLGVCRGICYNMLNVGVCSGMQGLLAMLVLEGQV